VDVWQADDEGFYDVQKSAGRDLRGLFTTDAGGAYRFTTIVPRYYPIPDDGPVGELLRATGRHPYRPAHIHFIADAPGHRPVTTHLFIAGSPYLDDDTVFGVKQSLVREVQTVDGEPGQLIEFDITLS
jgi:protocatechuate 3,4-dioxygenase beta subunit